MKVNDFNKAQAGTSTLFDVRQAMFTLNDGEQNDDNKEEESDVENDSRHLSIFFRFFDNISYSTTISNSDIEMEDKALRGRTQSIVFL